MDLLSNTHIAKLSYLNSDIKKCTVKRNLRHPEPIFDMPFANVAAEFYNLTDKMNILYFLSLCDWYGT